MSADEGRYSRVSRRKWNDARYLALSAPQPNGQTLFDRLLTGPELSNIPGVFQAWAAGIAQALRWPQKGFQKAMREVLGSGLAKYDESTGLWWLPNSIRHNAPENPNVVRSWKNAWKELPECALRDEAEDCLVTWAASKGDPWSKALSEVIGKPLPKPFVKPLPKQEQEQEQEQEHTTPIPPKGVERPRGEFSRNLEQALTVPAAQRARTLIERPESWDWVEPHKWPEVQQLGAAFAVACGWHPPKWTNPQGSAVRRLVGLLAEFSLTDLQRAVVAAKSSEWLRTKGLSALSDEVVRRLLSAPAAPAKKPEDIMHERREQQIAREYGLTGGVQ